MPVIRWPAFAGNDPLINIAASQIVFDELAERFELCPCIAVGFLNAKPRFMRKRRPVLKNKVFILLTILFVSSASLFLLTSHTQAEKLLAGLKAKVSPVQQGPISPWPSLAEQLQKSGVRPGTALERLIRNNQDFALLRLDEATDVRGLPPWARVWWRKAP